MKELLNCLSSFQSTLELQIKIYSELLPVLEKEEECISGFQLSEFEKTYFEKDQIVQRAAAAEERRMNFLKRICYLMSYDARGGLPSLRVFLEVFENYLKNVKTLVDEETFQALDALFVSVTSVAENYVLLFSELQPRIYRNQEVLRKLSHHFTRSVALVDAELNVQRNYDASGKSNSSLKSNRGAGSSLQIKA